MGRFSEMGYKVGDLFIITSEQVVCASVFSEGDLVEFTKDDSSMCPQFTRVSDGQTGYEQIECLTPYVKVGDVVSEPAPNKISFPCAVKIEGLTEDKIINLNNAFVELGADNNEDNDTNNFDSWEYYGVDSGCDTRFWDYLYDFSESSEEDEVTVYTYEEVMAMVSDKTSCSDDAAISEENEYSGSTSGETGCNQSVGGSIGVSTNVSLTVKIKGQEFVLTKDEVSELYLALCKAEGELKDWSME